MIKKSILMSITPSILIIISLFTQHFLAKYFTQTQYGQFQLMLAWIAILSFFSLNSFNTIVTKSTAQRYPIFFRAASKICFLVSLVGSIILLIVGFSFEKDLKSLFILLAIFFPFYSGINLGPAFYIGSAKFKKYSFLVIITQVLVSSFQILSVYFFRNVKPVLFFTLFIASVINLGITLYLFYKIKQEFNPEKNTELTKYGLYLTLINIIPALAGKIQYILLATLTNPATLAIYAVAQMIPEKIKTMFKSSLNPFSIYLASNDKEKSIKIARKAILLLFLFGIITTILVAIILPIIIKLIFGQKYYESIIYSLILLSVMIFIPINAILGSIILYHGYKKFYAKITTITNIAQIMFFIILIPFFEIYGIIMTIIFVTLIRSSINLIWFYKLPETKIKKSILILNQRYKSSGYENIIIKSKITGRNIIKIIETDYLSKEEKYPLWTKIIAKLSFTKYI